MKRKITLILMITALLVTTLVLSSCTSFNNFKAAFFEENGRNADTIKIGILEPQSGNDSENGKFETEGIEMANSIKPKVLGKEVELVYADTQSSIYTTETAVQDLLSKEPVVVLGPCGNAASLVASQYIQEAKVPAITITATNPLITLNNDYYFRTSFSEDSQGYAIAKFIAEKLKLKSSAIIKIKDDDTVTSMISKFENRLGKLTENENAVTATFEVTLDEVDYDQYVKKVVDTGSSVVFMPVDITTASKMFEAFANKNVNNITFVLPKELHTDELIELQQKYPKLKIAVTSDFAVNTIVDTKYYDDFIKVYEEKYGKGATPNEGIALGFDAYMIAMQGIEKAGSVDGKFVREALANTVNYDGASGEISFNQDGNPAKPINIDVIRKGEYKSIYTVK